MAKQQETWPPQGVTQGRARHQDASERRERHTEGGGAGWVRQRHGAAGEEGDGGRVGRGGVIAAMN